MLDIGSVSPTDGEQDGAAYTDHFGCTCYHLGNLARRWAGERCWSRWSLTTLRVNWLSGETHHRTAVSSENVGEERRVLIMDSKTLQIMTDPHHNDLLAETEWGKYLTGIETTAVLKAHELCGAPSVALDIGAAGGRWSQLLDKLGWKIICIDINPFSLDQCRMRLPQAICLLADPNDTTLPCAPESIGLILCIETFPVMSAAWFTSEAYRILKPNGLIVGVFTNKLSGRGYFRHLASMIQNSFDYYSTTYYWWRREARRVGFHVLLEQGLCWFPFSRSSNSPLVKLFTRVEHLVGLRRLPVISPWIVFIASRTQVNRPC